LLFIDISIDAVLTDVEALTMKMAASDPVETKVAPYLVCNHEPLIARISHLNYWVNGYTVNLYNKL